jgi:hypothetical protein
MGRTNAEAPSPNSRGTGRTGRDNENTTVTRPATSEARWCSRLTETGEPGTPAGDSRRGRFALKPGIPWKGENLPQGLDFGELIEGTENVCLLPILPKSIPDTYLSAAVCVSTPSPGAGGGGECGTKSATTTTVWGGGRGSVGDKTTSLSIASTPTTVSRERRSAPGDRRVSMNVIMGHLS